MDGKMEAGVWGFMALVALAGLVAAAIAVWATDRWERRSMQRGRQRGNGAHERALQELFRAARAGRRV